MTERPITFECAKARYVHRYTMQHVPAWARASAPNGKFYAPQFATDREWYDATRFQNEIPGAENLTRGALDRMDC